MVKYHKLIVVALSVLAIVVLQIFSVPKPTFRFLVPAFGLAVAAVSFYNRWYLNQLGKYNFWVVLRVAMLFFATFGVFLIVPSSFLRGLFLIASLAVIIMVEMFLGNFSENVLINETLIIAFGLLLTSTALAQDFPKTLWLSLISVFASMFLLARAFYEFIPKDNSLKYALSITMAFFITQIFWSLSFLPLHYSASSIILFNLFYLFLVLNYFYLYQTLTFKKMQFHFFLMFISSAAVILITPWKVLS